MQVEVTIPCSSVDTSYCKIVKGIDAFETGSRVFRGKLVTPGIKKAVNVGEIIYEYVKTEYRGSPKINVFQATITGELKQVFQILQYCHWVPQLRAFLHNKDYFKDDVDELDEQEMELLTKVMELPEPRLVLFFQTIQKVASLRSRMSGKSILGTDE